jgi:hypothetical protein
MKSCSCSFTGTRTFRPAHLPALLRVTARLSALDSDFAVFPIFSSVRLRVPGQVCDFHVSPDASLTGIPRYIVRLCAIFEDLCVRPARTPKMQYELDTLAAKLQRVARQMMVSTLSAHPDPVSHPLVAGGASCRVHPKLSAPNAPWECRTLLNSIAVFFYAPSIPGLLYALCGHSSISVVLVILVARLSM